MNQFKRAQVVMLPTKKNSSNIAKSINQDILSLYNKNDDKYNQWINQHLYIISDDEIKEGDWYYNSRLKQIFQAIRNSGYSKKTDDYKIIATTDTSLNYETPFYGMDEDNNFPQPSQQFIEKYIESYNAGQVITDVLVEYENNYDLEYYTPQGGIECCKKIDNWKLKINSKDNTITIKKLKDNSQHAYSKQLKRNKTSWNREEVKSLFRNFRTDVLPFGQVNDFELNQWISNNL